MSPFLDMKEDLLELARHLKQERLFVTSERYHLQQLNEDVTKTIERLFHVAWVAKQQRINLDNLILLKPDASPAACCLRATALETVSFIDSYKQLGFQDALYGEFLQQFRANTKLVATCMVIGELLSLEKMHSMVQTIISAVYGNCVIQEDERYVLQLLKWLMELQLATSDNPRRLLRHGSCAFSTVYKTFSEGLFSAKLFLTAALHGPVMHLLMEDDLFLDIDPGKAVVRFPPHERLRRFGKQGTLDYKANLQKYRNWTIGKLVNLTNRFIIGVKNNMYCFPQSISWLVKQMYHMVTRAGKLTASEVGAMCADLIFSFFICPAIVNPEPYGITSDASITYIARFNLMQVAQILQVLAMSKWEAIDPKLMDLYGRFEKDCMSSLLDYMLEGPLDDSPFEITNTHFQGLARSAVLITEAELHNLIAFLRTIQLSCNDGSNSNIKVLEAILATLPPPPSSASLTNSSNNTPEHNSSVAAKRSLLGKVGRNKSKTSPHEDINEDHQDPDSSSSNQYQQEDVLVISMGNPVRECPGMLAEHKVLSMEHRHNRVRMNLPDKTSPNEDLTGGEQHEKRTRFSLSHDQDSIGNTSDNLEAISEAASNHSVASSMELENENENDNLSDMVSANVSGRGTPNVSGRDTPLSQLEGEERRPLDLPVTAQKQNREDIEEKFGKFEIRTLMQGGGFWKQSISAEFLLGIKGDETKSIISDTWSTDVLASDSEPLEQSEAVVDRLREITEERHPPEGSQAGLLDVETASETWSTDVLASDSEPPEMKQEERLHELDTDDSSSVTRSELDVQLIDFKSIDQNEDAATPLASGSRSPIEGPPPKPPRLFVHSASESADSEGTSSGRHLITMTSEDTIEESESESKEEVTFRSEKTPNKIRRQNKDLSRSYNTNIISPGSGSHSHVTSEAISIPSDNDHPESRPVESPRESMMGMQTLGRLSLAMDNLPDDCGSNVDPSFLMRGLRESDLSEVVDNEFPRRNSAIDLLSEDLERRISLSSNNSVTRVLSSNSLDVFEPVLFERDESSYYGEGRPKSNTSNTLVDLQEDSHPEIQIKENNVNHIGQQEGLLSFRRSLTSNSSSGSSSGEDLIKLKSSSSITDSTSNGVESAFTVVGTISKIPTIKKSDDKNPEKLQNPVNQLDEDRTDGKGKKSFFKGFRFTFKGKNRKTSRSLEKEDFENIQLNSEKGAGDNPGVPSGDYKEIGYQETTDDILAKYRKKSGSSLQTCDGEILSETSNPKRDKDHMINWEDDSLSIDPNNLESSFVFMDAKRKLRLVLSTADFQTLPWLANFSSTGGRSKHQRENELVAFLKVQLAEAINLQDRSLVAQLHETLRCVRQFDDNGCRKLLNSLKDDYKKRAPYIAYLVRCRQGMLSTNAHLERLLNRIERDKVVCSNFFISVCVRLFLERRERAIQRFINEFQKLTMPDEKTDLVEEFLRYLYREMDNDPSWQVASDAQMNSAQASIERTIMSQIYIHALYPNGDGDVMRDQLLQKHMNKLAKIITPNHKDLRIPKMYHHECPWPSAKAEIIMINAYKTPKDKLQCVLRCSSTIMNLLSMANEKNVPAADDFMPVLVFVLIMANPLSLLSTVQYVNSFYEKRLGGEESYWWTQFTSAIEFIKTMDYSD